MAQAFVIHLHVGHGEDHHDLMLRHGQSLATWRLPAGPLDLSPGQKLPATRLPDHRLDYLTYEGPLSGGRGTVRRIDAGTFEAVEQSRTHWTVDLAGTALRGRYELRHTGPGEDEWALRRLA